MAKIAPDHQARLGQFLTPPATADLMAGIWGEVPETLRLLDPGAGIGSLSVALLERLAARPARPRRIELTSIELDPALIPPLAEVLGRAELLCAKAGIELSNQIIQGDFVELSAATLSGDLFANGLGAFDGAIVNPPYGKIRSDSATAETLRRVGVDTPNLYSAFLWLCVALLRVGGQVVAITPRSFCNGPYYLPFRRFLLGSSSLTYVHVFEARDRVFADSSVLQENIVFRAVKGIPSPRTVSVAWSTDAQDVEIAVRERSSADVVNPADESMFVHLPTHDDANQDVALLQRADFQGLAALDLKVSTGRVVDFRCREQLRADVQANTVPLIYPGHFDQGLIRWPKTGSKKPNALVRCAITEQLLLPPGRYVVVRRFSAKEEKRRIIAALYDSSCVSLLPVAFENHLNVFHRDGSGLSQDLAWGLCAYLNSSLVDRLFRQFNGHTQVNATDLRSLPYPSSDILATIGRLVRARWPLSQETLDERVENELLGARMANDKVSKVARARIDAAVELLEALGMPRAQLNDRSGLVLLALANLSPTKSWVDAEAPLVGITPIMDFARENYGVDYAPNTRETVRRQTMHQFRDAAIVVPNPDEPARPTNSPKYCYQLTPEVLPVLRAYGSGDWAGALAQFVTSAGRLRDFYAQRREMQLMPLRVKEGMELRLSPGGQNPLVKAIVEQFCPRFTPDGVPIYIGDTAKKYALFDGEYLRGLGVVLEEHGKMPDVVVHFAAKNWLVLVEAVTSHGPIEPKRREELKTLFAGSLAGLVFVTAFLARRDLQDRLGQIAWETEVWIADDPDHLLHFDGERFLGPYPDALPEDEGGEV